MSDRQETEPLVDEGAKLLVVEDFEPMSVLLTRVLAGDGHRVTAVATAAAARAACAAEPFDLIVTDVHIRGGSGTEIARGVAAERPGLRVLFVSGDAERDLDLRVPGALTGFLQKPFDISELVARVRRLLDADDGADAKADAEADAEADADARVGLGPADPPASHD